MEEVAAAGAARRRWRPHPHGREAEPEPEPEGLWSLGVDRSHRSASADAAGAMRG